MSTKTVAPTPTGSTPKPFDRRDASVIKTEELKTAKIESELKKNLNRSKNAPPKDNNKIKNTVEIGSALVSKFYKGFTQTDRGNIRVDVDDDLPYRLCDQYSYAIENYCQTEDLEEEDQTRFYASFLGISMISFASKLHLSAESSEKDKNLNLPILNSAKPRLPPKMQQVYNLIGKTDFSNDNQIRIREQSLAAKRHLVRGLTYYYGDDLKDHLEQIGSKRGDLLTHLTGNSFDLMYDNTFSGFKLLKRRARDFFIKQSDRNFEFTVSSHKFKCRLPKFPFPEDPNEPVEIDVIFDYLSKDDNYLFSKSIGWEQADINLMLAVLLVQTFKPSYLKPSQLDKNLSDFHQNLDPRIGNTKIREIIDFLGHWCITDYLSNETIQELASEAIHSWNNGYSKRFETFLHLSDFKYSEFGSESQIIQLDRNKKSYPTQSANQFDIFRKKFIGRVKATSKLKTNSSSAILGYATGLSKNLEFVSDFNLEVNSDPSSILREFLQSDFKR